MLLLDFLALFLVRSLILLLAYLPSSASVYVSRRCVSLLLFLMPRADKVGMKNLGIVFPEKTIEERRAILHSSYQHLAKNLVNYAKLPRMSQESMREQFDYSGFHALAQEVLAKSPGKGLLLPTMHFGSFELLGAAHALLEHKLAVLSRGFGFERLDTWWDKRRELFGNRMFRRRGGYREIVAALKAGEHVSLLADQNVKADHAVFVDLFGVKAATTKTVALAAMRTGAPIIFLVCGEASPGKYELLFEELAVPEEGSYEEKIIAISKSMNFAMEKAIRRFPDHWFWIHRRFKTRPPGERENLYE